MTTTQERQIRSIREAPKRRKRKAPAKGPMLRPRQDASRAGDAREALVRRVRSYLDVGGG